MAAMPGPRLVAACLAIALIVDGAAARAADAPDSDPTPPAIAPAPAAAPAPPPPAPGLEAGDTASTTAAPMAPPPAVFVDPNGGPLTPRAEPFYRKPWFWGGVAGLLLTAAILGTLTIGPSDAPTPQTKLGDMRAF